jgi:hypothetical protein
MSALRDNPWRLLPKRSPYVLPDDAPLVRSYNRDVGSEHDCFLQVDALPPEPFVGDPMAPVLLLSNNPGFGQGAAYKREAAFMKLMRRNLNHQGGDYPFLYLAPEVEGPHKRWWQRKLQHMVKRFGTETVARSVFNLVFFPYPSRRFRHRRLRLPSQEYTFHLLHEALARNAFIVFMRSEKPWLDAVPALHNYARRCRVSNTQNPVISPRNCAAYANIAEAIETRRKKR